MKRQAGWAEGTEGRQCFCQRQLRVPGGIVMKPQFVIVAPQ